MSRVLGSRAGYVCTRCALSLARRGPRQRAALHTGPTTKADSILELLETRGYVNQIAGDRNALDQLLRKKMVGFYAGIDPTAPSLHLGHLLPLMVLFWLYHHGHSVVSLVGGATAKVGDPSGRLTSRAMTAEGLHDTNFKTMYAQVGQLWENARRYGKRHGYDKQKSGKLRLLNNAKWLEELNVLDFLKTMGHGMRLGAMLGRDTVRNKMEKGDGMSFSEFTYPLLQAWDWWHMYRNDDIQVQIGGSDQYGNIIAGMDAVKYIAQTSAADARQSDWLDENGKLSDENVPMGLTVPLLTTASGEKFGKSAGNAIWLDPNMTSAFDLYGFLLRSTDDDVQRYLKLFTFVSVSEIDTVMADHAADPGKRKAQHLLAREVLELVHGPEQAAKTQAEHQASRSPSLASLSQSPSQQAAGSNGEATPLVTNSQRTVLPSSLVLNTPFSRILYHAGIVPTKSEGARLIAKGGAYVASPASIVEHGMADAENSSDEGQVVFTQLRDQKPDEVSKHIINGQLIFRTGKWKVRIVEVTEDADFASRGLVAPGWSDYKAAGPRN